MTVKGYIVVNEETMECLTHDCEDGGIFSWIFDSKDDLCAYVMSHKLKLEDYVIHYVNGEVLTFEVCTVD